MKHFLIRRGDAVALAIKVAPNKFAFCDAWSEVDAGEAKPAVSPTFVESEHSLNVSFFEERPWDITVGIVLVAMCSLIEEVPVPDEAFHVARKADMVVVEAVVALVLAADFYLHRADFKRMFGMQNHHASNGVTAIHERSRTFQNFH